MTVDAPKPLWTPENPEKSQLVHFQAYVAKKYNCKLGIGATLPPQHFRTIIDFGVETYDDLWQWSTTHVSQFWYEIYYYLQLKGQNPPQSPVDVVDESAPMYPRPMWFKGMCLNFAENVLYPSPEIKNPDTAIAIIEASEAGVQQRVTWTDLRDRVAQFATALKAIGVTKGDRVGGTRCPCDLAYNRCVG